MLRGKGLSRRKRAWEEEENDPMTGVANLSDVMLVLACGLMVAIVAFWRIDLSHIQDIIDRDRLQEVQNAEELIDSSELGDSFESIGTAFTDPETGKVYIIKP